MKQFYCVGLSGKWGGLVMVLVAVCLWPVDNVCSADQQEQDYGHHIPADSLFDEQLTERDLQPKTARTDAMASLLLKNLRFRELQRRLLETEGGTIETGDDSMDTDDYPLTNRHQHHSYDRLLSAPVKRLTADDLVRVLNGKKAKDEQSHAGERLPTLRFAMRKRQSVSVSELAQMLQDKMKARNTPDDNVKLQSLRFGRR